MVLALLNAHNNMIICWPCTYLANLILRNMENKSVNSKSLFSNHFNLSFLKKKLVVFLCWFLFCSPQAVCSQLQAEHLSPVLTWHDLLQTIVILCFPTTTLFVLWDWREFTWRGEKLITHLMLGVWKSSYLQFLQTSSSQNRVHNKPSWLMIATILLGLVQTSNKRFYTRWLRRHKKKSRARNILRLVEIQLHAGFPLGDYFHAKRYSIVKIE